MAASPKAVHFMQTHRGTHEKTTDCTFVSAHLKKLDIVQKWLKLQTKSKYRVIKNMLTLTLGLCYNIFSAEYKHSEWQKEELVVK